MGSPHITPTRQTRVMELHSHGWTSTRIAEETRLSLSSVNRILRANGLRANPPVFQPPPLHQSTLAPGAEPTEQSWHQQVRSADRRRAYRGDNTLLGAKAICAYLRISAINTLERWVERYGFPAIKRPDGKWLTTCTAIDEWIWLAAELHAEGKTQISKFAARAYHATVNRRDTHRRTRPYTSSHIERAVQRGDDPTPIIVESKLKAARRAYPAPTNEPQHAPDE